MGIVNRLNTKLGDIFANTQQATGHNKAEMRLQANGKKTEARKEVLDGKAFDISMRQKLGVTASEYKDIKSMGANYEAKSNLTAERLYDKARASLGDRGASLPTAAALRDNYLPTAAAVAKESGQSTKVDDLRNAAFATFEAKTAGLPANERGIVNGLAAGLLNRLDYNGKATQYKSERTAAETSKLEESGRHRFTRYVEKRKDKLSAKFETLGNKVEKTGVKLQHAASKAVHTSHKAASTGLAGAAKGASAAGMATAAVIAAPVVVPAAAGYAVYRAGKAAAAAVKAEGQQLAKDARRIDDTFGVDGKAILASKAGTMREVRNASRAKANAEARKRTTVPPKGAAAAPPVADAPSRSSSSSSVTLKDRD